jgi:hypothetical protein
MIAASRYESWKRWRASRAAIIIPLVEVLDGEAPEQLDEPDRLLVTDGIRADHAGRSCAAGPGWSELV